MTDPKPLWRVGRKLGRTLYCDNICVGMVDTPEIARAIVEAMNRAAKRVPRDADWLLEPDEVKP